MRLLSVGPVFVADEIIFIFFKLHAALFMKFVKQTSNTLMRKNLVIVFFILTLTSYLRFYVFFSYFSLNPIIKSDVFIKIFSFHGSKIII